MGLTKVLDILAQHKIVTIESNSCVMIDERIYWCKFSEDGESITTFECSFEINKFALWCERFSGKYSDSIRDIPAIKLVLSADGIYDLTKVPEHDCPTCLTHVTRDSAVIDGRFAHCPKCFRQFYKAPRIDGVKDPLELGTTVRKGWNNSKVKEKPPAPPIKTTEELMSVATPTKIRLKF